MQHLITQNPILNKQHAAWFTYKKCYLFISIVVFLFDLCYSLSCATNFLSYLFKNKTLQVNGIIGNNCQNFRTPNTLFFSLVSQKKAWLYSQPQSNQNSQQTKHAVVSGDQGLALLTGNILRGQHNSIWCVMSQTQINTQGQSHKNL